MNASNFIPRPGDALLLVDIQRDFLPGGALAVPGGDEVVAPANRAIARFRAAGLPIVASRDWHPPDHASFAAQGGPWPPHCVQHTPGAAFAAGLQLPADPIVIGKGETPRSDSYSDFEGTPLAARLAALAVTRLFVAGLATDYCVQASVLDALKLGFRVVVLDDAIRAIDVTAGDGERARQRMRDAGARFVTSADLSP